MALLIAACSSSGSSIVEMHFGTTNWVWHQTGPASDYIKDFHRKIPEAARKCQVTLLGLNGSITDGGEAAYFLPRRDVDAAETCLKGALPQGDFGYIERREWDKLTKENPAFPVPLRLIPKEVEMPPPPDGQ